MNSYVTAPARRDNSTTGYVTNTRGLAIVPTGYVSNVDNGRVANGYVTVPVRAGVVSAGLHRTVTGESAARGYAGNDLLQPARAA